MKKVIIVGAGIGGLSTAIRLLNKEYEVTILEKEDKVGGKVNIREFNGARFDLTATIIMTPDVYTQIFQETNKDYRDYFDMIRLDPIYNVSYSDKTSYNFYSDLSKMAKILESIEEGLSTKYINFLSKSLNKYLIGNKYFIEQPMIEMKEVFNLKTIGNFIKTNPFSSTYRYLKNTVSNKKIVEYLTFQSMYIGINPYTNSNIYTLIPAISHVYGLWYIKGGMYSYIEALNKLVVELGGKIEISKKVNKIIIDNNKAIGVKTDTTEYYSDIVVCNSDYPYSLDKLVKKDNSKKILDKEYSCSVFMIYLGLNKRYDDLQVHNIYLSENFKDSIQLQFKDKLSKDPSIYLYYPSKFDNDISGEFESILNIMVRVPNLKESKIEWNMDTVNMYKDVIINQIKNIKGLENIDNDIVYESYLTPEDIQKQFNSQYGTSFGLSHKLTQTTYLRPHMKDTQIENLYYIGSSTHPGNGVSVVIQGSKILVDKIIR